MIGLRIAISVLEDVTILGPHNLLIANYNSGKIGNKAQLTMI